MRHYKSLPQRHAVDGVNLGKSYFDYRKEEEKRNGAIRRARMAKAIADKKARKAAGIDIRITGTDLGKIVQFPNTKDYPTKKKNRK